ncbi:MAG: hypothetical protein PHQ18_02720 [Patescibacteria group bacterium]|nr:hypothetical protein [Patescibacteria group bacterium]
MNKKVASEITASVILLLVLIIGGIFLMQNKKTETPVKEKTKIQQTVPVVSQEPEMDIQTQSDEKQIYIPSQLKQIPDLKLVKTRAGDPTAVVSYYEVLSFKVDDGKMILASDSYCDGAGCSPGRYRFLQKGNDFALLTKYSDPTDGSTGIAKADLNISSFNEIDIPELNMPTKLKDPKTGATIKLASDLFAQKVFFDHANKTLLFSVDGRDIYTDNNHVNSESYYVEAIDGTEFLYELEDAFLTEKDIQWIDGKIHSNNFIVDPSGSSSDEDMARCELGSYYTEVINTSTITKDKLNIVGKNKAGQNIYGLKDINSPILKAAQKQMLYAENNIHTDSTDLIIFWEDPFGKLIRFISNDMFVACGGKPVIYLYPQKKEKVKVVVDLKNGFSITEPAYSNGWNVLAEPNGNLTDIESGKKYPYLFWEGGLTDYESPKEGFVIKRQDVQQFFKDKLSYIGLNEKEIYDFSDFWVRRMQEKPYYFITFTLNNEMDKLAPLEIEPKPDTIIRVLMDYIALDEYKEVPIQILPKISRHGFTVIEWGGILK